MSLGLKWLDAKDRDFLTPLAGFIDDQKALERFALILHLLGKSPMAKGEQPWQDAAVLVNLRNEAIETPRKARFATPIAVRRAKAGMIGPGVPVVMSFFEIIDGIVDKD